MIDGIRLISWDVDGTLYDLGRLRRHLVFQVLRRMLTGGGRRMKAALDRLAAFHRSIEQARRAGGQLHPAMLRERTELLAIEEEYLAPALSSVGCRPGMRGLLTGVSQLGLPQVVFSDFESGYKLAALGLDWVFRRAYSGEALGKVKPDPAGFECMARDFDVPPESILHIGDRADADGASAAAAGCQALLLGRDFRDVRALEKKLGLA